MNPDGTQEGNKEYHTSSSQALQTVVLEKTLQSPLENKEIKSITLNGNPP